MPKSRHRKAQKKKAAVRTKQMQEKRKYVQKLVSELEAEFAKLAANPPQERQQIVPASPPPLLTLTPTKPIETDYDNMEI